MKRTKVRGARPEVRRRNVAVKRVRPTRASLKPEISASSDLQHELAKAREQLTATSDILRAIAAAPGDAEGSLHKIAETTARLFGAVGVSLRIAEGDEFKLSVGVGQGAEQVTTNLFTDPALRPTVGGRNLPGTVVRENRQIHLPDLDRLDDAFADWPGPRVARRAGIRTMVGTPLRTKGRAIGALTVYRNMLRPFEPAELQSLQSFADQAVIAIENARLLDELRQRTDDLGRSVGELRALGEVSQAVNSTLDLKVVLSTIVAKAVQLSGTEAGAIYVFDDKQSDFHLHATCGMDQDLIDAFTQRHIGLDDPNIATVLARREPVEIADLKVEAPNPINEITLRAGYRARLSAPLFRGEDIFGLLVVRRRDPGSFPKNTVDLIKTFAAQSAVAIENARLFQNVETSLEDLRTAQDRLVQTEKLASLGQLTAGIAHEIKNPLNFVNNFSAVSVELIDELRDALGGAHLDGRLRAEISEIADMLQGNLDKVVQHGKRADSIVKNMLLHSRQGSGEHRPVDINALVDESLNLAYHGARAEKRGFTITLQRSFDPAAGEVDLFPQEITRVLLNLISNGFYAVTKRKAEANGGDYEPTLAAATKSLGDRVEIRIRDNGTGIRPEVRERMFNPFFTTKPAGEGTGLGLSISHDIVVKQHGGSIEVATQPGEFTEFRIVLPRAAASLSSEENTREPAHSAG